MLRILVAAVVGLALPLAAHAAGAVVESLKGSAQSSVGPIAQGQRLEAPMAITTAPGAQAFLKFDDGMQIVLHENSVLRMIDFRYTSTGATDRAVFELLRGAARVVTGTVARDNPKQFFFRMPQAQLMVERPADFTVALVNPAYISVKLGTVLASNGHGTVPLNAGTTVTITSSAAAPAGISAASMPASASSALSNLSIAQVSTPAGAASSGVGAGVLGGAAIEAPTLLLIGVGAAVAVGVAVAADDDDGPTPPPQH